MLAVAGLPIIGRYLLLPAVILSIFCGAGAFGWLCLKAGDPHRRIWAWFAVVVFATLIVFTPAQFSSLRSERRALIRQGQIEDDLKRLEATHVPNLPSMPPDTRALKDQFGLDSPIDVRCGGTIAVPNHRPVPLLALWLNIAPQRIVSAEQQRVGRGTYIVPANRAVAHDYVLDPHDPQKVVPRVPRGFIKIAANRSWRAYVGCG